ncbi:4'-phosphopantetheinyl transferase superfamily protein [Micromonospora sp. NPDC049101]|uniref:4'-phosphopantetheinyl transferase family protein n=1 Tax=Micromonospora sp. NPDC049101 TaxID=3155032 RepID=UPI00340E9E36
MSTPVGPVGGLVPAGVVVVEAFGHRDDVVLMPEEEMVVARAVDKRRREFATARHCARAALGRLGFDPVPILPGPRGAPGWPDGVVGSITHCEGYCASAVGLRREVAALGVDAEPAAALPEGVLEAIALPEEELAVRRLAVTYPEVPWDRLLFSAKESVYKTWFPVTGLWLDFHEARIDLDPSGVFTATLLRPVPTDCVVPLARLGGRWRIRAGLAGTAIAVPS